MTEPKKTKSELIAEIEKLQKELNTLKNKTGNKRSDDANLTLGDVNLLSVIEHSHNNIVLVDSKGIIKDLNKVSPPYTKEDIIGQSCYSFVDKDAQRIIKASIEKAFNTKEVQVFNGSRTVPDKGISYYISKVTPIIENDKVVAATIDSENISEKVIAEQQLMRNESMYKDILNVTNDAIVVSQNGIVKFCNPAAVRLFGVNNAKQLIGKSSLELYHKDYHQEISSWVEKINRTQKPTPQLKEKIIRFDGTALDVTVRATPFILFGKPAIYVIIRSIPETQEEEQLTKERVQNAILARHAELVPGLVFQYQLSPDGRAKFPYVSNKITSILELKAEDLHNDAQPAIERVYKDDLKVINDTVNISRKTLQNWDLEFRVVLPEKGLRWLSAHAKPERLSDGSVVWYGYISDNTERKLIVEHINESLREKEVLLKEVHHRVKNNLQVISSILNLQSSYVKNEEILNVLQESQNRIKSMAFIHESLYQNDDFSSINFSDYVVNLLQNLLQSYSKIDQKVKLNLNIENINLNLDLAIPCGLIINEIISNSLKYAFKENSGNDEITIDMKKQNNEITLLVGDNGAGLPIGIDFRNTESLGLQLVVTLVDQLEGTIDLDNSNGARYKILFRVKN